MSRLASWVIAALGLCCFSNSAFSAVGKTETAWLISEAGEVQYVVPIATPSGIREMAPDLAFEYSHRDGGNGWLGIGWDISGISTISRCPKTWAQDGQARQVKLDYNDRFCLDGVQLKLESGTYGANGAVYRTELESFSRVTSLGTAGNGPAWFQVETHDGRIYEYGVRNDSRIEALGGPTVRTWALTTIRDRRNNRIEFNYTEDATYGSFRIDNIQWASNPWYSISAPYKIAFTYETQPVSEIQNGYIAGTLVKDVTRMTRADLTYNGSSLVRRYNIAYEANLSSASRSRVASITECAGAGGTDCLPATTFSYTNGTNTFDASANQAVVTVPGTRTIMMDANGDGRSDLIFPSATAYTTGYWKIAHADGSGNYSSAITTSVSSYYQGWATPIDYNADGKGDLLYTDGSTWWVAQSNGNGFDAPINTGATSVGASDVRAFDANGDGLEDLIWSTTTTVKYRLREWGGAFSATIYTLLTGPTNTTAIWLEDPLQSRNHSLAPDFNGDAHADLMVTIEKTIWSQGEDYVYYIGDIVLSGTGEVIYVGTSAQGFPGDFNGDGLTDLAIPGGTGWFYRFGTGTGLTTAVYGAAITGHQWWLAVPTDWDGDGFTDIMVPSSSAGTWQVVRSNGESLPTVVNTGVVVGASLAADFFADTNGDGLTDVVTIGYGTGTVGIIKHSGVVPDLMNSAIDGFGNAVNFSYGMLSGGALYNRGSNAQFPYQDYSGPVSVVTNANISDGIGGTYNLASFYYEGAAVQRQGRGFAGFRYRSWIDSRDNTAQRRTYKREFPFTGMIENQRWTHEPSANAMNEDQRATSQLTTGAGYETTYYPYFSQSVHTDRDPSYGFASTRIVTDTVSSIDAVSGVPTATTRVTSEPIGSNGISAGQSWTESTSVTVSNNTENWCLGVAAAVYQSRSHTGAYGGAQLTRTTTNTWDTTYCRPSLTKIEPNTSLEVTTSVSYDGFGNQTVEGVTGYGMATRTTTTTWSSDGRFPITTTNALGHQTSQSWNGLLAVPTSVTDPNGLTTSWLYDNYGRKTRENRPNGTYSLLILAQCDNANNFCWTGWSYVRYQWQSWHYAVGGSVVNATLDYHDMLDRNVWHYDLDRTNNWFGTYRYLDAFGRTTSETQPFRSGIYQGYRAYGYDIMGRLTINKLYNTVGALASQTSGVYSGLTTILTDENGKTRSLTRNANDQQARAADHSAYHQRFDYDAFGNAVRVTDYYGTVLQTSSYNVRGMRLTSNDVDAGNRSYAFNALGELITQTDANAQTTTIQRDVLGREVSKSEPNAGGWITTTLTWGNSAAAKNIGRLGSSLVSGTGIENYSETYAFDGYGRLGQTTYASATANHLVNYTYNSATGLQDSVTYPTSTAGYRHQVVYEYQYGYLWKVRDIGNTVTYWQANADDPYGNITDESLGNGLRTTRGFDAPTGRPTYIRTGPGGGSSVQNLNYVFDAVGNLTSRNDANQSITENLGYDNLHRLTSATVNGGSSVSVQYNAYGSIISKSDVGAYSYHGSKIHAVVAAGGNSFTYDANGNVATRNGSSVSWYANDKPKSIAGGSYSSTFEYGPRGNYWKQVAVYSNGTETTRYIGGLLEIVHGTATNITAYRHHIKAGGQTVAIYSRGDNGATSTIYPLRDHLGSVDAITDSAGVVIVRESFDPWGKRRGANWQGAPSAGDMNAIGNATRRGFTDHTMLDNLGLVHMNGRVYDPGIGRFLSADPFIQDPDDTQAFNRYSYVDNRPLSFTDPSGYFASGNGGSVADGAGSSVLGFVGYLYQAYYYLNLFFGDAKYVPPPYSEVARRRVNFNFDPRNRPYGNVIGGPRGFGTSSSGCNWGGCNSPMTAGGVPVLAAQTYDPPNDTTGSMSQVLVSSGIDIAISFIPGVGQVKGIYDFVQVLRNPDSSAQDILVAGAGVLPGGKLIKGGVRISKAVQQSKRFSQAAKSLGANPFKGKTAKEIAEMLEKKGYVPRGPDPAAGRGTYVNPNTGRGYHIDASHPPPKGPHVGVHRPRDMRDTLPPRDYPLEGP